MANNKARDYIGVWHKSVICTHPTTPLSGYPVRVGAETGVALTDESTAGTDLTGNATGYTSVDVGPARWNLPVKGIDDQGNVAVVDSDPLYYVDADIASGTGFLSKKRSGYFFGFARAAVNSGSTTTIAVDHIPATMPGTLNMSANLATGIVPLDVANLRIIASNVIGNTSEGMFLDGNTAPSLQRVNSATDKALRVIWAASSSVECQFAPAVKPPDLDGSAVATVHLMIGKDTNTDTTVTVAVGIFDGVGDTNAGGNTAALAVATLAEYTVAMAAADLAEAPGFLNIVLTPGTHTTDAIWLYAAWIEYNRV